MVIIEIFFYCVFTRYQFVEKKTNRHKNHTKREKKCKSWVICLWTVFTVKLVPNMGNCTLLMSNKINVHSTPHCSSSVCECVERRIKKYARKLFFFRHHLSSLVSIFYALHVHLMVAFTLIFLLLMMKTTTTIYAIYIIIAYFLDVYAVCVCVIHSLRNVYRISSIQNSHENVVQYKMIRERKSRMVKNGTGKKWHTLS